jgi:hypothetical protein
MDEQLDGSAGWGRNLVFAGLAQMLLPEVQIQGTALLSTTGASHGSKIIDLFGLGSETDFEHAGPSAPE